MFERLLRYFRESPERDYDKAERLYEGARKAAEKGWTDVVSSNLRQIRSLDIDTSEYLAHEDELTETSHRRATLNCIKTVYSRCDSLTGKNGDDLKVARVGVGDGLWVGSNGVLYVKRDRTYTPGRHINPENKLEFKAYVIANLGHDPWIVASAMEHIDQTSLPQQKKDELKLMLPKIEGQVTIRDEPVSEKPTPVEVMQSVVAQSEISEIDAVPVEKPMGNGNRYPFIKEVKPNSNRMPVVKRFLSGGSFVN